ncbi:MAG TPA: hypothetical protein VF989_16815 [Polyangiaceae bacterium]
MPTYRPRMVAFLTVPVMGTDAERKRQARSEETLQLTVHPSSVAIERNDHNEADALRMTCDWLDAGVDPRLLDDAIVQVHIDNADEFGRWRPTAANVRFIGIVNEVDVKRRLDDAAVVEIEARDYTSLFLDAKPFHPAGVPSYSQSLEEAWRQIVRYTPDPEQPSAEVLADNLVFQGVSPSVRLGDAVAERFRKLANVPTKPDTDAWAVWQQCVGMLGLISYIELDRCIVTTATNYYTERDAPLFVWGRNLTEWGEGRVSRFAGVGVGITSFDPETGTTLEAVFGEPERRKRTRAKTISGSGAARHTANRRYFSVPGVSNQEMLDRIARRVWEEMSRQELEGSCTTDEMRVQTENGAGFDVLSLKAGDSVVVQTDPQQRQILGSLPTHAARVRYLTELKGYNPDTAELIARNIEDLAKLKSKFLTKRVRIEVSPADETFSVAIDYINRIQLTGATEARGGI